jgi:hypothetical protein
MADHDEFREVIELDDEHPHSYDRTDPAGKFIFAVGAGIVAFVIASGIAITFYFDRVQEEQIYTRVLAPENNALKDLRTKEDQELHSFGYIDRPTGKVRLTIDRAMQLIAQDAKNGQPKYPTAPYRMRTKEELAAAAAGAAAAPAEGSAPAGQQPANGQQPAPTAPNSQPGASTAPAAQPPAAQK